MQEGVASAHARGSGGGSPQAMANLLWGLVHLDASLGYAGRSSKGSIIPTHNLSSSSSSRSSRHSSDSGSEGEGREGSDCGSSGGTSNGGSSDGAAQHNSAYDHGTLPEDQGGYAGAQGGVGGGATMEQWLRSFWAATLPALHAWPRASLAVAAVCLARIKVGHGVVMGLCPDWRQGFGIVPGWDQGGSGLDGIKGAVPSPVAVAVCLAKTQTVHGP
eukprot:scaffold281111_cov21-Tisochrysis_lutea.AAC.1